MLFRICKSRYSTPRYELEIDHIYVIFLCEITAVRKSVIFLILTIDSRKQLYHTLPINLNCPIIVYCTFISQYEIYSYDLLKKKKKKRETSIKIPWTFFDSMYTRYTQHPSFHSTLERKREIDLKETQKVSQWRRSFYRISILPRIRGRSQHPLPVWRVSPSEIRDSIKPHPPDRGKKRARDRGRL